MTMKDKVFVDIDGVLADIIAGAKKHPDYEKYNGEIDKLDIFKTLEPIKGSLEAMEKLINSPLYDVYILSTPPWDNIEAWSHKRDWIGKYLPAMQRRLILTHHKDMLCSSPNDIIIDDRLKNGVEKWKGVHLHYGTDSCKNWENVLDYLNI